MSGTATFTCPNCERPIEFNKKLLDDPKAVSYCRSIDCFFVFYPATGKPLESHEYQVHERSREWTLGIRPDRGGLSWLDSVRPQNIKVPCPECGYYFHQTKRLDRVANFKCPRCEKKFSLDPKQVVTVPAPTAYAVKDMPPAELLPRSRGISPDRLPTRSEKQRYTTRPCPSCKKDVRFVEALLRLGNHVVICSACVTMFNPVTNEVIKQNRSSR